MRIRKKKWTQSELERSPLLVARPELCKGAWNALFGGKSAVCLELGCGKGGFLAETASLNKDVGFLGLERQRECLAKALRLSEGIPNILFILADVSRLTDFFGAGEISRLYINFCDPWPNRKKWEKRRLTHENFLDAYKYILKPEGGLIFKTDSAELFDFSIKSFEKRGFFLKKVSRDAAHEPFNSVKTEYERRFIGENKAIYYIEAAAPPNGHF